MRFDKIMAILNENEGLIKQEDLYVPCKHLYCFVLEHPSAAIRTLIVGFANFCTSEKAVLPRQGFG